MQSDAFLETQTVQHAQDKCMSDYRAIPMQSFDYDMKLYSWNCN